MARKKSERVTIRFSPKDVKVLDAIQMSGGFEDTSTAIRFCINLTSAILKTIPASIGESFVDTVGPEPLTTEEIEKKG